MRADSLKPHRAHRTGPITRAWTSIDSVPFHPCLGRIELPNRPLTEHLGRFCVSRTVGREAVSAQYWGSAGGRFAPRSRSTYARSESAVMKLRRPIETL